MKSFLSIKVLIPLMMNFIMLKQKSKSQELSDPYCYSGIMLIDNG